MSEQDSKTLALVLLIIGLIVVTCLFNSCASEPYSEIYNCSVIGKEVHWTGTYKSDEEAARDAQLILARLIEKKLVPQGAIVSCNVNEEDNRVFPRNK